MHSRRNEIPFYSKLQAFDFDLNLLKIQENRISIKATTADKLGFLGREEGIAVFITTLLDQNGS